MKTPESAYIMYFMVLIIHELYDYAGKLFNSFETLCSILLRVAESHLVELPIWLKIVLGKNFFYVNF
jgi:hypothetical protein